MNWTEYRKLPGVMREVDFHPGSTDLPPDFGDLDYYEKIAVWENLTLSALKEAHRDGIEWVMFRHGQSTSRMGATTARSSVRKVIRGRDATPFILRSQCIKNHSVFVARIRQVI